MLRMRARVRDRERSLSSLAAGSKFRRLENQLAPAVGHNEPKTRVRANMRIIPRLEKNSVGPKPCKEENEVRQASKDTVYEFTVSVSF